MSAATFPPDIDFPYSLRVCAVLDNVTSVPSRGCKDKALVSCSVASIFGRQQLLHTGTRAFSLIPEGRPGLTRYTLTIAQLHSF